MDLLAAGHELASHTYSHASARTTGFPNYVQEVEKGFRALLKSWDLTLHVSSHIPMERSRSGLNETVGPKMQSCRGIFPGLNGPQVDLNLLRANHLYGDTDQFASSEDANR